MMNNHRLDTADKRAQPPRQSTRVALDAEVTLRRPGHNNFRVRVFDASPQGCKIEFVERPRLGDHIWIKFGDLEALQAIVCWMSGFAGGVRFEKPIHPAVFEMLVAKLD